MFPVKNVEELVHLKSEFVILDNCLLVSIPKFLYSTLLKSVQFAVLFPKIQFVVRFLKTVRYSVQVSTGTDHQFLNLNASLVSWMARLGSFWKALRKDSTLTSSSKMASNLEKLPLPQVHYFLGSCYPHCLPSSFGGCESHQNVSSLECDFCRSCLCSNFRHWAQDLCKRQATCRCYHGGGCHGSARRGHVI